MKNYDIVTADFSRFGYREMAKAKSLLDAYMDYRMTPAAQKWFGEGVKVMFNCHSGHVFLSDDDYNVLMLNDEDILDLFISCPNCGYEGFPQDVYNHPECEECKEFAENYLE